MSLGQRGARAPQEQGAGPIKKRRQPKAEIVAARLAKLDVRSAPTAEGVVALNPGFFALERIRAATVGGKKARAKARGKTRSR